MTGSLLQHTVDLTKTEVIQVRDNTASIAASVDDLKTGLASLSPSVTQIRGAAVSIQQELGEFHLDFNKFQRYFSATIDGKLLEENARTRAEILSLRDALLGIMTGDKATFSGNERASAAQLTESSKRCLEIQTRKQLLQCPSTLRRATNNTVRMIHLGQEPALYCHCRSSQELLTARWGVFSFEYEAWAQHNPQCPFHQSNMQSWSYTLAVRLLPFLNKTVALTLGATFGAGTWAMATPLRFYATVKRAESPIFRAFDEFARVCGQLVLDSDGRSPKNSIAVQDRQQIHHFRFFEWDTAKATKFLDNLIEELSISFRNGTASGSDMDEFGNTMLHVSYSKDE